MMKSRLLLKSLPRWEGCPGIQGVLSRSPKVLQREGCGCFLGSMQQHDDHSPGTGLDEADRKRLAAALAGAREARVYRRLEALLLVAEGRLWRRRPAAAGSTAPACTIVGAVQG